MSPRRRSSRSVSLTVVGCAMAVAACGSSGGAAGGTGTSGSGRYDAALNYATCIRGHGVPNFPDPVFPATGGARITIQAGSGIDPRSPAFQAAMQECGGPGAGRGIKQMIPAGGSAGATGGAGG